MAEKDQVEFPQTLEYLSNDNLISVWLSHNELRWRVVLSTPIFAATVTIGWYSLLVASFGLAADVVLGLGVLAMFAYYILISRLSDYAGAYHDQIKGRPTIKKPALKIPAQIMAVSLPVILASIFIALLFIDQSDLTNLQGAAESVQ